jgi:hypothetical protein
MRPEGGSVWRHGNAFFKNDSYQRLLHMRQGPKIPEIERIVMRLLLL